MEPIDKTVWRRQRTGSIRRVNGWGRIDGCVD